MVTHILANVSTLANQTVNTRNSIQTTSIGIMEQREGVATAEISTASQVAISKETVDKVVRQLETQSQTLRRDLQFNVDDSTGRVIVTVIDSETNEVIRQIPSDEILALSRHLAQALDNDTSGLLFESKA